MEPVRLNKLLAQRGLCSRREADAFIADGRVTVNGERTTELGLKVPPDADVRLDDVAARSQARQVTVLLHKPLGYVSGQPEPGYLPAARLFTPETRWGEDRGARWEPAMEKGLAPAGRLDIDSTGLLVLTQDGRIARLLVGVGTTVEKEYVVRVRGEVQPTTLDRLRHGLALDGEPLRPARVDPITAEQLRFILVQGKKRQIRRMCELVGLQVVALKRVRIGRVKLGALPPGQWRLLRSDERF
jgi:23S rRNA pseudouridine2604 synthase